MQKPPEKETEKSSLFPSLFRADSKFDELVQSGLLLTRRK
jgi:hypothetical protein